MFNYAQIDEMGRCVGVSSLSGEILANHMIPIDSLGTIDSGDFYADGKWTRQIITRIDDNTVEDVEYTFIINADGSGDYVEQKRTSRADPLPPEPETDKQKIAKLETENTDLKIRVGDVEMFVADLISATP